QWILNRKKVIKTDESKLLVQDENIDEANLDDGLFVVTIPMIVNNNKCATSKIIICLYPVRINSINLFNHEYNIFHQLLSISNCSFICIYERKTRFRTKKTNPSITKRICLSCIICLAIYRYFFMQCYVNRFSNNYCHI